MDTEPTPVSAPMHTGLSSLAFLADDFARYPDTAALRANRGSGKLYAEIRHADLVELDRTLLYNGHPTVKCRHAGDTDRAPTLSVIYVPARDVLWLRAVIRFSLGWSPPAVGPGDRGRSVYRILGMSWAGYTGGPALQYTDARYALYWTIHRRETGGQWEGEQLDGDVGDEWSDASWYTYVLCHERTGIYTFRERAWWARDPAPPVKRIDVAGTVAVPVPPVAGVVLGPNADRVRLADQNQYISYGQWEVVDGVAHPNPFRLEDA